MASPITLRAFNPGDRFRLNGWLNEPHVVAWFGARAIADAECALAQSSPSALVRLIQCDGQPIGYLHAYDCALTGRPRPAALADGAYLLTALIGAAAFRGKGHGAAAAALLRDEIFATTLAPSVVMLVPLKNEPAVRAMERVGFAWREIWHAGSVGPCWIMASARPRG